MVEESSRKDFFYLVAEARLLIVKNVISDALITSMESYLMVLIRSFFIQETAFSQRCVGLKPKKSRSELQQKSRYKSNSCYN